MAGSSVAKTGRRQAKERHQEVLYDRELEDLPAEMRWREWMLRVEAVIFAAAEPVSRGTLARVVGKDCSVDLRPHRGASRPVLRTGVGRRWLETSNAFALRGNDPDLVSADAGRGGGVV
jgi:hypothetical protein